MKKLTAIFALPCILVVFPGCTKDVPKKFTEMQAQSILLSRYCLTPPAPVKYVFKGSMATVSMYCAAPEAGDEWRSQVRGYLISSGWSGAVGSMQTDAYCLSDTGISLIATPFDSSFKGASMVLRYPSSICKSAFSLFDK